MADLAKVSIVLARTSGLPEDRVAMSFWWYLTPGWTTADLTTLAGAHQIWLTVDNSATATAPLAAYMASTVATTGHTINVYTYDMVTGERLAYENAPPERTQALTFAAVSIGAFPAEVALCVSLRNNTGAVPGGGEFEAPAARRRGRVYFGPIGTSGAGEGSVSAGDLRPHANLREGLLHNTAFMRDGAVGPAEMVVYSRPFPGRGEIERPGRPTLPAIPARPGQAYLVEQCWTDDAFDTQRRRGAKRTTRSFA